MSGRVVNLRHVELGGFLSRVLRREGAQREALRGERGEGVREEINHE